MADTAAQAAASAAAETTLKALGYTFARDRNVALPALTDEQRPMLAELRARAAAELASAADPVVFAGMTTDAALHRFIRARNNSVDKAFKMLRNAMAASLLLLLLLLLFPDRPTPPFAA